jgi:hypothetical protein
MESFWVSSPKEAKEPIQSTFKTDSFWKEAFLSAPKDSLQGRSITAIAPLFMNVGYR